MRHYSRDRPLMEWFIPPYIMRFQTQSILPSIKIFLYLKGDFSS